MAVREHILSELGVGRWALRSQATKQVGISYVSRLGGRCLSNVSATDGLGGDKQIHDPRANEIALNADDEIVRVMPKDSKVSHALQELITPLARTQNANQSPPSQALSQAGGMGLMSQSVALPTHFVDVRAMAERFLLFGVAYGDWVILTDGMAMGAGERSVWQSLCERLAKHPSTVKLEVRYPLVANDYPQYQHFHQGSHSLLGFLLRLCGDKPKPKLAILTSLPNTIELGGLSNFVVKTPSLLEMSQFNDAKHLFWRQLHDERLGS